MSQEPPQLNGMKATDITSFFVLGHTQEGLTRIDANGKPSPGVARSWELSDHGAVFHLRNEARWSDGQPITARDFVYAWRTVLQPRTASSFAFLLFPVRNAQAISEGKLDASKLGVSAPDDHTLKVEFERPCAYFLGLTSAAITYPIREDIHRRFGDKYGADANQMIFSGPFLLSSWIHGASLKMTRNPHYWNRAAIRLDAIEVPAITPDTNAKFNFFKDRKVDLIDTLGRDDLLKATQQGYKLRPFADGSVLFLAFNFRAGRATRNLNLRKALAAVFDPSEYVQRVVTIPGTQPGLGLVPRWMQGHRARFRDEHRLEPRRPDFAAAKRYLEAARRELGGRIPPLTWLTGDTAQGAREAEYFQQAFRRHLGITLHIDKQIFKQRLAKMNQGRFDIASSVWGPDYNDPLTFVELATAWNAANRGQYRNAEVDQKVRAAQVTADPARRLELLAQAEAIALDELAFLPTHERTVMWMTQPWLKNVIRHPIGPDPDLTQASIVSTGGRGP